MRRPGSLDRLGLSLAVWPTEPDRHQPPLPHPARREPAQYRLARVVTDQPNPHGLWPGGYHPPGPLCRGHPQIIAEARAIHR